MLAVKNSRDLVAGSILAIVGLTTAYLGKGLSFGTLSRMGSGFLPNTLSWIVVGLGALILLRSLFVTDDAPEWPRLRPFAFICLGPVLFALLIGPLGLMPTIMVVAAFVRCATPQKITPRTFVFPAALAAGCAFVFVYLLNLPIPLWF
ncbi:tripartite tricarboxylate transporter TctB family protein [Ferrovibrio sp.]|uniref:tripartite tricarboxylate transporter TctB family protein n=1 Tax=Ferrovibrio sp. TaxID=1917215 RepID=UPI000CC0B167|nr:tripartite tricarboxylate transporter TctB family protein [Ferrovibrio sp.]PJI42223.1 MAG: hypothetical protein CTR53_07245 [Ferrovibrio sp.]